MDLDAHIPVLLRIWRQRHGRRGPPDRLNPAELAEVARGVKRLSAGLSGDRQKAGRDYLSTPEGLGAYLLWFWPVSYTQSSAVLRRMDLAPAGRALDLGSGPGPVSRALYDLGWSEVWAVDRARAALDAARELCPGLHTALWSPGEALPAGQFSLIFAGHLLNELWKAEPDRVERRAALLESLLPALAPGGRIALMEPASHAINRETLALRDALRERMAILAPCFTAAPCPALAAGAPCHGDLRWRLPLLTEQIGRAAHIDKSTVAYGYLVLAPGQTAPDDRLRVVSEKMLNKAGRERVLVCGAAGRFPLSVPPRREGAWAEAWAGLQRGDAVRVARPERRENGLGLGPASVLELPDG